jgi:diaminopimelate decarboxylase
VAEKGGNPRHVVEDPVVHGSGAFPMATLIEGDRSQAGGDTGPSEIVVALLARAGAVEDHDPASGLVLLGQPERVGQSVLLAGLGGPHRGHDSGPGVHRVMMPAAGAARDPHGMIAPMTATASGLSHVYPRGSRVNERGHLEIAGCDALDLVAEFGSPLYVVAEEDLRARARAFVEALSARHADGEVIFASKAFPCTAVYRTLAEEGLGCDVASGGELYLALQAGVDPARIYLHGNAKSEAELRQALEAGVGHIVLDSFDDLKRLNRLAAEAGRGPQPVLLRVTPGVAGSTHQAISTGQADSKFGFAIDQAAAAIADLSDDGSSLELRGLHFHIGSQLLELEPFVDAVQAIAGLGRFRVYDFGGGLGAAYTAAQDPPAAGEYVQAVVDAAHRYLGADIRIILEPGRALVANSTVTLYTVETVKRNVSTWVAVDGGMSDNLRPMLYGAVYEAVVAGRPLLSEGERCHLAGKHCESGDVIVRDLTLPEPAVGDVIATPVTGAYGYALANNYNSVPRPAVVFCRDGAARLVVRRETYEDLGARDV